jgi:hypothetical protein
MKKAEFKWSKNYFLCILNVVHTTPNKNKSVIDKIWALNRAFDCESNKYL